jgi:hypothetical protein
MKAAARFFYSLMSLKLFVGILAVFRFCRFRVFLLDIPVLCRRTLLGRTLLLVMLRLKFLFPEFLQFSFFFPELLPCSLLKFVNLLQLVIYFFLLFD